MNHERLEKSLRVLRDVNRARLVKSDSRSILEALLRQHDYDSHDRIDPKQLTIFDVSRDLQK
jgi:hypothetical protein